MQLNDGAAAVHGSALVVGSSYRWCAAGSGGWALAPITGTAGAGLGCPGVRLFRVEDDDASMRSAAVWVRRSIERHGVENLVPEGRFMWQLEPYMTAAEYKQARAENLVPSEGHFLTSMHGPCGPRHLKLVVRAARKGPHPIRPGLPMQVVVGVRDGDTVVQLRMRMERFTP